MKLKDELSYLWEEYQYRHDLVWRVTLRLTFVVAFLSIIPYVNDSLSTKMGKWMLVPPGLSVLLAIFGSAVIANEYKLLLMIKDAYRCLQSEFVLKRSANANYARFRCTPRTVYLARS